MNRYQTPLYEKIRPKTLNDILGNIKVVNILNSWKNNNNLKSFVIWGDPGTGKSTIINALINEVSENYEIYKISGATEGAKTLKTIINKEENMFSKQKILFVDEIHRLNKAEQDVLLLSLEKGDIILFGATTENPAISLNRALLSRINIFKTQKFKDEDFEILFERISYELEKIIIEEDVKKYIINYSNGDLRRIVNLVEAMSSSGLNKITLEDMEAFTGVKYSYETDDKYSFISAFIKSIRGSDPDAAVLYLAYMLENGEDPMYIARRIVISAAEDIGLSDPNALNIAVSAMTATEKIGYPECLFPLSEAAVYLATTSKSNSMAVAYFGAKEYIEKKSINVPKHLKNSMNKETEKQGIGVGYKYPHDFGGFVQQQYMPEGIENKVFYKPKNNIREQKILEKLTKIWKNIKKY
ncbi:MAG TPA: replication-associated recombination protein A [Tepiditoga sp.]|nr:replication-associated recombination protein A [Tepiditoga sp.]